MGVEHGKDRAPRRPASGFRGLDGTSPGVDRRVGPCTGSRPRGVKGEHRNRTPDRSGAPIYHRWDGPRGDRGLRRSRRWEGSVPSSAEGALKVLAAFAIAVAVGSGSSSDRTPVVAPDLQDAEHHAG